MTRKYVSGITPAEMAERMTDNDSWSDSRQLEVKRELTIDENTDQLLMDPEWWYDVLESLVATRVVCEVLSSLYANMGNREAVSGQMNKLFSWAYKTARSEAEEDYDRKDT